jgi:DNA-binding SARP family transcriptional activator/Tfp pilus assembly protein PilF
MQFRVLGPVELAADGQPVPIGYPRQRCVLAVLLAEANRPVLAEHLIDRVWGDAPPDNVRNVLSGYITRLRQVIRQADRNGTVTLRRQSRGYVIEVDPARVDLHRFHDLVERSRHAADGEARALLSEALGLWRGPAFADMTSAWLLNLREALEQERLATVLRRNDIALAAGSHADLVSELHQFATTHPLDERIARQLMLALYRSGRQADALAVYADVRARFARELGLDPGPELRTLEQRILNNDTVLSLPRVPAPPLPVVRPRPVPRQLPGGSADFTGRRGELAELDAALAADARREAAGPSVLAITGTAGVGKTALAVHWARRTSNLFPDGQLFVNLRGHTPGRPVDPSHALAQFLRALGLPAEEVPLDPDEASAVYRTLLADRRVLVVLDDAHGPDQVRPLLPGSDGCAVLITSRNQLSGLVAKDGARQFTLDLLHTDTAHELVARIISEHRASAEPAAVVDLVRLCAHLPLALRIAAANLANSPDKPVSQYVRELTSGNRLDELEVVGDREAAVRTAFTLSYGGLELAGRQLFRRLGMVPGLSFTAEVAAALLECSADEASGLLKMLNAAHVVEADDDRYRMHDLLRLFALERARAEETDAGLAEVMARLLRRYLSSACAAAEVLYPQMLRLPVGPDLAGHGVDFAEHAAALDWLDEERANLLALIAYAADNGPHDLSWLLADALRGYFWLRRFNTEWLDAAGNALRAAEETGDPVAQAAIQLSLGTAHWTVARHATAVEHFRLGLAAAERGGWVEGEASLLGNLASVQIELGELEQAEANYRRALELHESVGNHRAWGVGLGNLGNLYWEMGALHRADDHFSRALVVHEATGALVPRANCLVNLGGVRHDLGDLRSALANLTAAIALCHEIGAAADEATALDAAARAYRDTGRHTEAFDHAQRALVLARQIGTRRIEASALITLGTIQHCVGRDEEALAYHEHAAALCTTTGDPRNHAEALLGRAISLLGLGRLDEALTDAEQALARTTQRGYRLLTGRVLTALARIRLRRAEPTEAVRAADQALLVQGDVGDRLWQARSLHVQSLALRRLGDLAAATALAERADALCEDIGMTEQRGESPPWGV